MKDNLIKNLLPFFRINQLISGRACSGPWSACSISYYVARLVCGLAHTSAEFLSRFQGIMWGRNHSQQAAEVHESADHQGPQAEMQGINRRITDIYYVSLPCWTASLRPVFCSFPWSSKSGATRTCLAQCWALTQLCAVTGTGTGNTAYSPGAWMERRHLPHDPFQRLVGRPRLLHSDY